MAAIRTISSKKLKLLIPFTHYIQSLAQNPTKTLTHNCFYKPFSSQSINPPKIQPLPFNRDGNYNDVTTHVVCPGCGVCLQDNDAKRPGFFIKPVLKRFDYKSPVSGIKGLDEIEASNELKRGSFSELSRDGDFEVAEKPGFFIKSRDYKYPISRSKGLDEIEACSELKLGSLNELGRDEVGGGGTSLNEKPVVCARCHSLRHYGKVKDPTVENLLPDFDFDHTVGRRLNLVTGARAVVLMVVDAADFDGSFPRKVAKLVSDTIDENMDTWKEGKSGNLPRVVLVVTKIDLLPSLVSPTRLEHWVRARAREGGANKITSVHLVSAFKNWGLKNLFDDVVKLAGPRGNVWAIGAQNAGKSTLINGISKYVSGKVVHLTEAPVPGTTLGIVRVEGVLPGQTKLFDTPGLLHPHQISTRLNREEQKLVQISKELKPRTYRLKVAHSVHIGGLMRLDIEESSVDSIYVTVWASPYVPLHMGKTENVENMLTDHFGRQLEPPIGEKRVQELGQWVRKEFRICGNSWESSSVDIAAGGVGWFAIGLKGEASVGVWCYDGVEVVLRNSLIPHRANNFEVAGFTVSKIVSKADQALNKSRSQSGKKKQQGDSKSEPLVVAL